MTHAVLQNDDDILEIENIGENMLKQFISEGDMWMKFTKRKLKTFRTSTKTVSIKIKDRMVNLREERGLLTRLLIVAKSRQ